MKNKIMVVTGYIPLPILNLDRAQFEKLGAELTAAVTSVCPIKLFVTGWQIQDCWVHRYAAAKKLALLPSAHNVPADRFPSPEVMLHSNMIQNQKSEWLWDAADDHPDVGVFVWLDFGIFKQKPFTAEAVHQFLRRVEQAAVFNVTAPGIQGSPTWPTYGEFCDRFCGSTVVVPRTQIDNYGDALRAAAELDMVCAGRLEWEVNYISAMEKKGFPVRQYQCWWDQSQLLNFPG